MDKRYGIDPRLLSWIRKSANGCPQTLEELAAITVLDSKAVNYSRSTSGYISPDWMVRRPGDFSLIGEMTGLQQLRIANVELDDFSFLAKCKNLVSLDLEHTNFSDCRLLAGLSKLERVLLPPRRTLRHKEVLDHLGQKARTHELLLGVPSYSDDDYKHQRVVLGEEVRLSYQGSSQVRCVLAALSGAPLWKNFSSGEEDNWLNLPEETRQKMTDQLTDAIRRGRVREFSLSFEPWCEGHYLTADIACGWAAVRYEDNDDNICYTSYNPDYDTVETLAPVEIGGQTPVAKMWALTDMEEVARIVRHFLETGQLAPGSKWLTDTAQEEAGGTPMSIQYRPTPLDILKLLGLTDSRGSVQLEQFQSDHGIKLPPLLSDFFSAAWNHPLFETSDIWVTGRRHFPFRFSYERLEDRIADWQEDWNAAPSQYADDFCFQLSKIPREQWPEHIPNYLEIGSDYSAGVVTFGIRADDLSQADPPVYILNEGSPETAWRVLDDTLSLFLMRVLADVLTCSMYDTAREVLEKAGWKYCEMKDMPEAQNRAEQLGIDLSKAAQCGALYAAADTPDVCRYCCIEGKKTFFLLKNDAGNHETTCVIISRG